MSPSGYLKRLSEKYHSIVTFFKALIDDPRATGAVLPSSHLLAKEMASQAVLFKNSLIIELGGGTGVITEALLESGIPEKNIIVIEYSRYLVKKLRDRFPNIQIIEGNAQDMTKLLSANQARISTVISSLPLRSLPEDTVQAVLNQIPQLLLPKGKYIQFTYDLRADNHYYPQNKMPSYSKIVWFNIPPAKIDVFSF